MTPKQLATDLRHAVSDMGSENERADAIEVVLMIAPALPDLIQAVERVLVWIEPVPDALDMRKALDSICKRAEGA